MNGGVIFQTAGLTNVFWSSKKKNYNSLKRKAQHRTKVICKTKWQLLSAKVKLNSFVFWHDQFQSALLIIHDIPQKISSIYLWICLVSHDVIHKVGTRVSVTTNCYTLQHTICCFRNNVIQFVWHTAGPWHIRYAEWQRGDIAKLC